MPRRQIVASDASTYDFLTLAGEIEPMGQTLEEVTRANVDGQAYRQHGNRGTPFEMVGVVDSLDEASVAALYIALKATQGTVVRVYDEQGNYADDAVVLMVQKVNTRQIAGSSGGLVPNSTQLLTVKFTLCVAHPPT